MGKKGSEHVDWMISIGIFLVALISIFILLKPGVQKEANEGVLLDLLQEKFTNDFYWGVKIVPISIAVCKGYFDPSTRLNVEPVIRLTTTNWGLTKTEFVKNNIVNENKGIDPNYPLNNEITCAFNNDAPLGSCANYKCFISKGSNPVVYYFTYSLNNPAGGDFDIKDGTISSSCYPGSEYCDYRIGAVEDFYGLNNENYGDFRKYFLQKEAINSQLDYRINVDGKDPVKDTWGFPQNKEFFIRAEAQGSLDKFNYETAKPEEKSNIYTKAFRTNVVDKYGDSSPVTIYFGVWG